MLGVFAVREHSCRGSGTNGTQTVGSERGWASMSSPPARRSDPQLTRIVVTSPMKCGSTYVADVLRRYFGAALSNHDIRGYDFGAEQNLSDALTEQLRGTSFSINLHLRPYGLNVAALGREAIAVLVLWRNLADVIVSFDDHVRSRARSTRYSSSPIGRATSRCGPRRGTRTSSIPSCRGI